MLEVTDKSGQLCSSSYWLLIWWESMSQALLKRTGQFEPYSERLFNLSLFLFQLRWASYSPFTTHERLVIPSRLDPNHFVFKHFVLHQYDMRYIAQYWTGYCFFPAPLNRESNGIILAQEINLCLEQLALGKIYEGNV